jgi:hypothetical protein
MRTGVRTELASAFLIGILEQPDITPTLVDLERTHILYVNAHFKPFAAIGLTSSPCRRKSAGKWTRACAQRRDSEPGQSGRVTSVSWRKAQTPSARVCNTIKLREYPKALSTTLRQRCAQWNPWETT